MPARARLTLQARRELNEAIRWIAADNPRAAKALGDAVRRLAVLVGEHPLVGPQRLELAIAPFRVAAVRGFPYVVVYDPTSTPPTIVRIVHGARDLPEILRDLG
jgi:toxin ParE1/3/4